MSIAPTSTSSDPIQPNFFEDNFVLPEDPNVNVPLSTRINLVGKIIGLACLGLGVAGAYHFYFVNRQILFYSYRISGLLGYSSLNLANFGRMLLVKKSYCDPNLRKQYREELEQGKISLLSFRSLNTQLFPNQSSRIFFASTLLITPQHSCKI